MRRLIAAFVLTAAPLAAQQQPTDSALIAAVDSLAGEAIASGRVAGLSLAVERRGRTLLARGYGFADQENRIPANARTVYRIGSITKQFTSAAVMQLVEQGRISLDDEIGKYLPGYPTQGHRVTVHHLLNHTSGIRSYTGLGQKWFSRIATDLPPDSIIALFKDEPFDFAPGADFRYNNSGYFLLGRILEQVAGKPYEDVVQERLLTPAKLDRTGYCPNEPWRPAHAIGYRFSGADLEPSTPISMTHPYAAGALCSNVLDLLAWSRALAGGKVVTPASYARMTRPDTLPAGKPMRYGYGLVTSELGGHRMVFHGGGINGFVTQLSSFPADSLTIVVLTNTEGPTADRLAMAIGRIALGVPAPRAVAMAAAERQRYVGSYGSGAFVLAIRDENGGLVAQATGQAPTRLEYQGDGRFTSPDAPGQVLSFDVKDGQAVRLSIRVNDKTVWTGERAGSPAAP